MRIKRKKLFFSVVMMMFIVFLADLNMVQAAYEGGIVLDEDLNPVCTQDGLMPSQGDINIAVFLVDFPSIQHSGVNTTEYIEKLFFSETEKSLQSFYKTASYDKLSINGDVYGWYTMDNDREYYETGDYPPREMVLRELVEKYDSRIDFSKYDNDNDGYTDGVYIIYAGDNGGWGSAWWSYVGQIYSDVTVDGIKVQQIAFINEYSGVEVLCHETGHMLGLIDYYNADTGSNGAYLGGNSLMYNNDGDLDALSKIILGWIEPEKITGAGEVTLNSVSRTPDVAVIYPKDDAKSSVFFLIEYITVEKNNAVNRKEGLRVYRVNITQNDTQTGFQYMVSSDEPKIIEIIAEGLTAGDELTPYVAPSTYLVYEENDTVKWLTTGISIDDIKINGSTANFNVSYEEGDKDIEYDTRIFMADNRLFLKIIFDSEMQLMDEDVTIYASDGKESIPMLFRVDNYPELGVKNRYYLYSNEIECEADTKYSITIPAGTLQSSYGVYNEEIVLEVTTSKLPKVEEAIVADITGTVNLKSENIVPIEGGKHVYAVMKDSSLYLITALNTGEVTEEKFVAEISDYSSKINFRKISVCGLDNGEYIILQRASSTSSFELGMSTNVFRVNTDGSVEKIEFSGNIDICYTMGNTVAVYTGYQNGNYTVSLIKEDNSVEQKIIEDYINSIDKIGDDRYMLSAGHRFVTVVDSEFNIINTYELSGINSVTCGTEYKDYAVIVEVDNGLNACFYNDEMELLFKKNIMSLDSQYCLWGFYKLETGYAAAVYMDKSYNNVNGSGSFAGIVSSPVAQIVFLDESFSKVCTYSVDNGGEALGDLIKSVTSLSSSECIFSTNWGNYYASDLNLTSDTSIAGITISETSMQLAYGEEKELIVYDENGKVIANKDIIWKSTNESIVTVSDGKLTIQDNGSATIIAAVGDIMVICAVETSGFPTPISGVWLKESYELYQENRISITLQFLPGHALEVPSEVIWTSSDESVVLVKAFQENQRSATLYALKDGSATVTATAVCKNGTFVTSTVIDVVNVEAVDRNSSYLWIGAQSGSKTINKAEAAVFAVAAYGNGLRYQWQSLAEESDEWTDIEGETHAVITVVGNAENNGKQYRCVITGDASGSIMSNPVTLTVKGCPTVEQLTTIYDGVDYSAVYSYEYYVSKYPEITGNALEYFVTTGMALGHQASEEFNLLAYKSNYPDLGVAFGSDNVKYYEHYINSGKAEGRNAKVVLVESETKYYGVEYADVYNYDYYINNNPDLKAAFGDNKAAALIHFANMGMKEGRQACENFGPKIYKFNYPELQNSFGEDMVLYYHHYMDYGKAEGRNGATRDFSAYCKYEGVDYTPVYNYEDYIERNPDVFDAYGLDANAVLKHFVTVGMAEGRQGSDDFNYNIYRSNYPDLETAFGENRAEYYHHYINSGYNEGRNAATSNYTSDTVYAGVDYADVYSYDYYVTANPDVAAAIGDNKIAILAHFVRNGMAEGRQGSAEFNVSVYMEKNTDLVASFGSDLKAYYMHYIECGKAEGRVAK